MQMLLPPPQSALVVQAGVPVSGVPASIPTPVSGVFTPVSIGVPVSGLLTPVSIVTPASGIGFVSCTQPKPFQDQPPSHSGRQLQSVFIS